MPSITFRCQNQQCRDYKKKVSVGDDFVCRWEDCKGNAIRRGEHLDVLPPFWMNQSFLAGLAGLFALAFVGYAFLKPNPPPQPIKVEVIIPPTPVNNSPPSGLGVVNQNGGVTTRVVSTLPPPNPNFEIETIVTCGGRILDHYRALGVATASANTKFINGQQQTDEGRTSEQALDQLKLTFQDHKMFEDKARQLESKIEAELNSYLECIQRLNAFSKEVVINSFDFARRQRDALPRSRVIAVDLAQKHWAEQATRDQIKISFEQHSE